MPRPSAYVQAQSLSPERVPKIGLAGTARTAGATTQSGSPWKVREDPWKVREDPWKPVERLKLPSWPSCQFFPIQVPL